MGDRSPSLTPIDRTASATEWPCAIITSSCRTLATISSGLCLFLGISVLRPAISYIRADHFNGGGSDGDPLARITDTTKVAWVMKNGAVVWEKK